jgi:hypothetical protein
VPLHDSLEVEVFMSGHHEESATPAPDTHVVAKRARNELAALDLRAFADEPHGAARRPERIGIVRRSKALLVLSFPVESAGVRHSRFIGTGQAVLRVGRRFRTGSSGARANEEPPSLMTSTSESADRRSASSRPTTSAPSSLGCSGGSLELNSSSRCCTPAERNPHHAEQGCIPP